MSDQLKQFINNNRELFDDLEPVDFWNKIDGNIKPQNTSFNLKKLPNMLKYGFGASVIVVSTFAVLHLQKNKINTTPVKANVVMDSSPASFKTPKLNAAAILLSDIKKEKQEELTENENIVPANPEEEKEMAPALDTMDNKNSWLTNPVMRASYATALVSNEDTSATEGYMLLDTLFKNVKRLEVEGEFCDVNVRARAGGEVLLHGSIGEGTGDYVMFGVRGYQRSENKIRFKKKDSVLKVWIASYKVHKKITIKSTKVVQSVLDFEVPPGTQVEVVNHSGSIAVSGLENKQMLLETSFGNIKAENINAKLTLKSSSGNIVLNKILGEIRTETSFGSQVLEDIKGNLNLRASSGSVTVKRLIGNLDIVCSYGTQRYEDISGSLTSLGASGSVFVKRHKGNLNVKSSYGTQNYEGIEGDIVSKASSGNIKINDSKGVLSLSTSYGNITGKDVRLMNNSEFTSSSGSIAMCLLNEMKDLSFDLRASSGKLVVDKENSKNVSDEKLTVGQGAILIKGISSYGSQNYK